MVELIKTSMQRQIKFRAWGKANKHMYDGLHLGLYHSATGNFFSKIDKVLSTGGLDSIEIMQFTGLLDKDGHEIYEGDIVKNNDRVWEVYWDEAGYWAMAIIVPPNMRTGRNNVDAENSEIIGNIYQNPELIKN